MNNTVAIGNQSWLANLAQFQAGGGQGFFDDTEVFRCTAGNQALAYAMPGDLSVVQQTVTAIDTSTSNGQPNATLTFQDESTAGPFDFVIVATPVTAWQSIQVDGGNFSNGTNFPYAPIGNGPAIKYLAPVEGRFWIQYGQAPSGQYDSLGMTWEGTDNQADTSGFDLTVFTGGTAAQTVIDNNGTDDYFAPLITQLYPGFSTPGGTFTYSTDYPMLSGYSCPAPGQVIGAQQSYPTPYNGCLFVAGEHTSPAWFGFMEGALESGVAAFARIQQARGVTIPSDWGGTTAL